MVEQLILDRHMAVADLIPTSKWSYAANRINSLNLCKSNKATPSITKFGECFWFLMASSWNKKLHSDVLSPSFTSIDIRCVATGVHEFPSPTIPHGTLSNFAACLMIIMILTPRTSPHSIVEMIPCRQQNAPNITQMYPNVSWLWLKKVRKEVFSIENTWKQTVWFWCAVGKFRLNPLVWARCRFRTSVLREWEGCRRNTFWAWEHQWHQWSSLPMSSYVILKGQFSTRETRMELQCLGHASEWASDLRGYGCLWMLMGQKALSCFVHIWPKKSTLFILKWVWVNVNTYRSIFSIFLVGWTSIYQLFLMFTRGTRVLTHPQITIRLLLFAALLLAAGEPKTFLRRSSSDNGSGEKASSSPVFSRLKSKAESTRMATDTLYIQMLIFWNIPYHTTSTR